MAIQAFGFQDNKFHHQRMRDSGIPIADESFVFVRPLRASLLLHFMNMGHSDMGNIGNVKSPCKSKLCGACTCIFFKNT